MITYHDDIAKRTLLPPEKVWKVPPAWWTIDLPDVTDSGYYMLVCPNLDCGNADLDTITIYSTDLDVGKWYGQNVDCLVDEVPMFEYAKSIYTEGAGLDDRAECQLCRQEWTVNPSTHYYEYG